MKKSIITGVLLMLPMAIMAQSPIDLYNLNPYQLRGTSRFMSMGGAFTALGGDLSTMGQNPAGIGLYRSSEVGLTLDIDMQKSKTAGPNGDGTSFTLEHKQTKVAVDNFGYVGTVRLGNEVMPTFSFGVSYGRLASFDRSAKGGSIIGGSLSNYISGFTQGVSSSNLSGSSAYQGQADWLSILAYNACMINSVGDKSYQGLWKNGTFGNSMMEVRNQGYVDEYNIDFGGNIMDKLYWGLGFGITDIDFRSYSYYDEMLYDARIPNASRTSTVNGSAEFGIENWNVTNGNGFNVKFGLILKPINELRFGFAIHTPTYYNMTTSFDAEANYEYINDRDEITKSSYAGGRDKPSVSDVAYYDWQMRSPWKFMFGAAAVLGGKAILSVDYERQMYDQMKAKDYYGYDIDWTNQEVCNDFKATDVIRVGAEYRLSRHFSLRAGFNYTTSNVEKSVYDGETGFATSGTNPSYELNDASYYITAGLGYRYKGFYADLAYVNNNRKSKFHGFNSVENDTESQSSFYTGAPIVEMNDISNHIVMSIGYKF